MVSNHGFQPSGNIVVVISGLECTGEENFILECVYNRTTSQCSNRSAALQCIGMLIEIA